eukprot:TRINITY_DN18730_c0_g1_i4.p1 TRINITY_DN18730_c0_g1~~TRINITY_DN18730_c0_g1_i4.p1  ORF type:complete len:527 (-),score=84.66 TRINITY_DN18730_c0_g1_i4:112-1692(-)
MLSQVWPSPRLFQRIGLAIGFISAGEVLLLLWFLSLVLSTVAFWSGHKWQVGVTRYSVNDSNICVTDSDGNTTKLQQWARIVGQVCNIVLSLLAMPTARSSVWSKVLGVSWEAMQVYHRVLGYTFMGLTLLHQLLWWCFWWWQQTMLDYEDVVDGSRQNIKAYCAANDALGDMPHDILAVPQRYHADNFSNPLIVLVWWTMLICMGVFACHYIRRRYFELFYYTHHAFLVIYIGALWHATSLWYFLISGLGLWFVDRLIRFSRGCSLVGELKLTTTGYTNLKLTWIEIGTLDGLLPVFEQGQYCFINIPQISLLEWHPFTIASAPSEGILRFYIRAMGEQTWTGGLHKLAENSLEAPLVNVDGPYGLAVEYWKYRRIVMVFGGIGVTPGLSVMEEMTRNPKGAVKVDCLLILRDRHVLDQTPIGEQLNRIHNTTDPGDDTPAVVCKIHAFLTRHKRAHSKKWDYNFTFSAGRPSDLTKLIKQISEDDTVEPADTLVFMCGPPAVVELAEKAARAHGYQVHMEIFEL